jgi:hypothetical protein
MVDTASYYEELRGRVRGLLITIADQLPASTVALVSDMIDANESGVALETISEMLVESQGTISTDALMLASELVETMRLDPVNVDRLRPLAVADDQRPGS